MDPVFVLGLWKEVYDLYLNLMLLACGGLCVCMFVYLLDRRVNRLEQRVMFLRNDVSCTYKV